MPFQSLTYQVVLDIMVLPIEEGNEDENANNLWVGCGAYR